MTSVQSIKDVLEIGRIKERWKTLQENCLRFSSYLSFEWYFSALQTIDRDKSPYLLLFTSRDKDLGLAPLIHKEARFIGKAFHRISFVNNLYTQYQGFLYKNHFENIFSGLINQLLKDYGQCFVLDLNELRLNRDEEDVIEGFIEKNAFVMEKRKKPGCLNLVLKKSFEETVQSLKRHTRKEFRRKIRRLNRMGQVALERIQGSDNISKHLDTFFRIRQRGWKGKEPHPDFLSKICEVFEEADKLYFYALTLDTQPISYLICLRGADVMYGLETTYDQDFAACSPGIVLFYRFIESLFTMPGIREFDLGRGEEQYKKEWTHLAFNHTHLLIYPDTGLNKIFKLLFYDLYRWINKRKILIGIYSILKNRIQESTELDQ